MNELSLWVSLPLLILIFIMLFTPLDTFEEYEDDDDL